ncbi:hypothetical protein NQZ68_008064 [Dissostichus eleginoides]|nr:hypothetical protein NQZ68_008064 [Dissostichus eleginoides]
MKRMVYVLHLLDSSEAVRLLSQPTGTSAVKHLHTIGGLGAAPKAKGIAAEIHASPAGFRRGKLAEHLALPEDCGSAPMASSLATENHKPTASSGCSTVNNYTEGDGSSS